MSILLAWMLPLVLLAPPAAWASTAPASNQEASRASEPLETVVADLEAFVPEYLEQESVPGVAMALLRDGRIAWVRGFGSANRWNRRPVQAETVFEVASISKVMTAFIALRLVDQGQLDLDVPLNRYLAEPWLPPSPYRDVITLRHCLSHSAGFGHNTTSRETHFPPGSRYSYSAMGIAYVQEVVEKVSGKPLDLLGEELLFGPLQMSSSSFARQPQLAGRTANGHIWAVVPGLLWAVLFLVSLVLVAVAGWPLVRLVSGRWRPRRRAVVVGAVIALALPLTGLFALLGSAGLTEFAWIIALYGTASVVGLVVAYAAASRAIERLLPGRSRVRVVARAGLVLMLLACWGGLSIGLRNLPVPAWPAMPPNGAGSARATAGDLSRFLIELARPTLLSPEIAAQLSASQVRLSDDLSWGLGPGILHGAEGDALWQWGQHIDFQSLMIVYPESGFGVVVLTNSDLLNPDVAVTIAHRALGGRIEALVRAIHLEFNSLG